MHISPLFGLERDSFFLGGEGGGYSGLSCRDIFVALIAQDKPHITTIYECRRGLALQKKHVLPAHYFMTFTTLKAFLTYPNLSAKNMDSKMKLLHDLKV